MTSILSILQPTPNTKRRGRRGSTTLNDTAALLEERGTKMSVQQVSDALGIKVDCARARLNRLIKSGRVKKYTPARADKPILYSILTTK